MPDDPPKPTIVDKSKACCSRYGIFIYDLLVVFGLLVVAYYYVKSAEHYWLVKPTGTGTSEQISNIELSLRAVWFGALGGAHRTVIARPLRSAATISPAWRPEIASTAPFWLVSTIAPAPAPTARPAPAAT